LSPKSSFVAKVEAKEEYKEEDSVIACWRLADD